jgi:hypothetical protein
MSRSFARVLSPCLAVTALVVTLAPSRSAHAEETSALAPVHVPMPDDVQLGERHPGMLIGGVATLALFYGNSIAFTATSPEEHVAAGYIPVVGPFVAAATLEHPPADDFLDLDFSDFNRGVYVALGVGQVVGAALTVAGAATLHEHASEAKRWRFAPTASSTGGGFVLAGTL